VEITTSKDRRNCDVEDESGTHAMPAKRMNTSVLSTTPDSSSVASKNRRLLIVDDHPVFRHGISQFLSEQEGLTVCAEAENGRSGGNAKAETRSGPARCVDAGHERH
jgi:hypothetical protein